MPILLAVVPVFPLPSLYFRKTVSSPHSNTDWSCVCEWKILNRDIANQFDYRACNHRPHNYTPPRPEMKQRCTEYYCFTAGLTFSREYQWEFYSWLQREYDWAQTYHTVEQVRKQFHHQVDNWFGRTDSSQTSVAQKCRSTTKDFAAVTIQECQKNKIRRREGKGC